MIEILWVILIFLTVFAAVFGLPWWLNKRDHRPPVAQRIVRPDYHVFDMRKMTQWGNAAFWMNGDNQICIFSVQSPRVGDVIIDGVGNHYAAITVERMSDPDDQFFVTPKHFDKKDLPERQPGEGWAEDLIL